jgi:hypothetical protein
MVYENFGRRDRLVDIPDEINRLLIRADIPKLRIVSSGRSTVYSGELGRKTYSIAGDDDEFVKLGLNHRLSGVGVPCDEVFHIGIAESPGNSEHSIHTVIENQTASISYPFALVLVTTLVVI